MSVSIILIPAAIAAIASAAAGGAATAGVGAGIAGVISSMRGGGQSEVLQVRTRMKDRGLLAQALGDLGAVDVEVGDEVAATVDGVKLLMQASPEGIWAANFTAVKGAPEVTTRVATELAERLDAAYAARVQTAVAERIREKATDAGLELVSETVDDDQSVTMTLNVRA
ncbi:hypothetical protein [Pseudolysinimonas sp.]|jgi:hypothetical protein|uniref:hypothetical protein n=1 Tax=Pseudolysinimonas sp. TaxID=2680009 RepID=UPI0037844D0F